MTTSFERQPLYAHFFRTPEAFRAFGVYLRFGGGWPLYPHVWYVTIRPNEGVALYTSAAPHTPPFWFVPVASRDCWWMAQMLMHLCLTHALEQFLLSSHTR